MLNDEHKLSLEELYHRVDSSPKGLSQDEAEKRQQEYGYNIFQAKKKAPLIVRFGKHLVNFFALLLWVGAILSFTAEWIHPGEGNLYIGIALVAVIFLNAIFTFIQEYQSERIMESFEKMMPVKITVLRDGEPIEIHTKYLVPGDIILLNTGDKVPADARLIEENGLKVDNSPLTGESEPLLRKLECTHDNILESRNMVFSSTLVQAGNGKALVYKTGMETQIGQTAQLTREIKEIDSPLKKELNRFIKIISAIAIALGITFFMISLIKGDRVMACLTFAIGIIVANVPEGLLPTVTLALSMASKKMAKKKALIKNLESVETLGAATVICTDKTGTLTQNKIAVNTLLLNLKEEKADAGNLSQQSGFDKLLNIFTLCNNAVIHNDHNHHGDPIDLALLLFADKFTDINKVNHDHIRVHESPFDSKTKRMIATNKNADNQLIAHLKGAPEVVLEKCNTLLLNGKTVRLTDEYKNEILNYYQNFASRGERVLAIAYKTTETEKAIEEGFTFVALIGMLDPPRPEVPDAIKKCKEAGIKLVMITGDYSLTAEAIAKQIGMLDGDGANIMTGEELSKIDNDQLKTFLKKEDMIFARIIPIHKMRIVKVLQSMGEIVAVTGDGVNDAPALKKADMGVAMGIAGTDVAKEAAKMVLLDDNFATIVNAIQVGRTSYDNIKKFIAYILTSNVPEILPFIAFVLLGIPLPLTIILILAIDLGTDLLPALGLGIEKPEADVMKRKPRSKNEHLLSKKLLFRSYGIIGMLEAAAGFFAYFTVLYSGGWHWGKHLAFDNPLYLRAVSAFFASIILCQIANVLICRTKKQSIFKHGLFTNHLVWLGILTELILLSIIIYSPFTREFFGTTALTLKELCLSLPFVFIIFFLSELRKWLIRKDNHFIKKYFEW